MFISETFARRKNHEDPIELKETNVYYKVNELRVLTCNCRTI